MPWAVVCPGGGTALTDPLNGVVLAGGQSSRLGVDKALLRFGGAPLLGIVVDRVAEVCNEVVVAVDRPERYEQLGIAARLVADLSPGHGPLSGLQAGLQATETKHVLVVACDVPFLNVKLLRYMAELSRSYEALVPWLDGRWHPLHSIYARSCREAVDAMLAEGGGSMRELLARLEVRRLEERELRRIDPDGLSLLNVNRESDVTRARAIWRSQGWGEADQE
jgi:molybdopterin-guanine dinucleotide biosynthesis protein A